MHRAYAVCAEDRDTRAGVGERGAVAEAKMLLCGRKA